MKKIIVIVLVGLVLTACGVVLGEPPAATPAVELQATVNAQFNSSVQTAVAATGAAEAPAIVKVFDPDKDCTVPPKPGQVLNRQESFNLQYCVWELPNTPAPTATVQPTATAEPTAQPTDAPTALTTTSGNWEIQYFDGATDEMRAWSFKDLEPNNWPVFPNVENGAYPASQGLEYGEDLSVFCQYKKTCDFVTAARHYRLYTGDYNLQPVGECKAKDGQGCALMVINVGEVTSSFEDQHFDTGWTVTGRYWDGNYLPQAIWAGMSHATANMLNLNTALNPGGTNAGANCSVPDGCVSVESTFAVISGNEVLMIGRSTVTR